MSLARMTLSQAEEIVRRLLPGERIDWERPIDEACRIVLDSNLSSRLRLSKTDATLVFEALKAYAAHLSFEAGRAFELDGVRNLIAEHASYHERGAREGIGKDVRAACAAKVSVLREVESEIADEVHHAEPEARVE